MALSGAESLHSWRMPGCNGVPGKGHSAWGNSEACEGLPASSGTFELARLSGRCGFHANTMNFWNDVASHLLKGQAFPEGADI